MNEKEVKADILRRLGQIKTISAGSSEEGTAYLILQMFDVAKRRLSNKRALELVYVSNPNAPKGSRDVISRYVKDEISIGEAEKEIDRIKALYERVLVEEYGLRLSRPFAVFIE